MKKHLIFLFLLILTIQAEGQFSDDFTDGDFTLNPPWLGDTGKFEINSSGQLHLLSSGVDSSMLVTSNSRVTETQWEFWIKLSFNTSANNYARVYLVSDNSNLEGALNGYFLQIGGTNDSITFFKQTGILVNKLFRGNFACTGHSSNILRGKMIHDSTGTWTLYMDDTGGKNYSEEGHCQDVSITYSSWFGVFCHYTSSNSTKFSFDDFYTGPIRADPALTDSILTGDLVINEILANPAKGGEKFVELYNRSDKILNLRDLALGLYDSVSNLATGLKPISESDFISHPGDYSVLTPTPGDIMNRYYCPNPDAFIQMNSLPSLGRENGTIVLARNNDRVIIDHVDYSMQMYSDLLTVTAGISLERLNPSLSSLDVSNWHSASENCGFATPGYRNSEFLKINPGEDEITVSPIVFTPDDDGKDDVLWIGFQVSDPGFLVNVTIFDAAGNRVRCLAGNRLLSTGDSLLWDGRDDNHKKLSLGIYILYFELLKPEGKTVRVKKTCILGGKR